MQTYLDEKLVPAAVVDGHVAEEVDDAVAAVDAEPHVTLHQFDGHKVRLGRRSAVDPTRQPVSRGAAQGRPWTPIREAVDPHKGGRGPP